MKKIKKYLCIMLAIFLILPLNMLVKASDLSGQISENIKLGIIDVLTDIEQQKDMWGLANIDFSNIKIGNPISTYNYIDARLEEGTIIYPLIASERIVLLAIPNGKSFQITNGLVPEINKTIAMDTAFALVYDSENVYVYADDAVRLLKCFDQKINSRSKLSMDTKLSPESIKMTKLTKSETLGYKTNVHTGERATTANISCSVSYVTQIPYENICWAASTACIVNYKTNSSLTALRVAKNLYGDTLFNRGIHQDELRFVLQFYGLDGYCFDNQGYFDNKIYESILADNPVGGVFRLGIDQYHVTVIYGINIIAGRIQIMDPQTGMTTATYSDQNKYSYTSTFNNATLELYGVNHDDGE